MGGLLCKNANIANENIEVALIKAVRVSLPEQRKARENYSWIDFSWISSRLLDLLGLPPAHYILD